MKRFIVLSLVLAAAFPASAAEMYYNRLSTGDVVVPAGTYGAIVVPEGGYKATRFPSALGTISESEGDFGGSYAPIIGKFGTNFDLADHTVSGWFKVPTKTSGDTTLCVEKTLAASTTKNHRGNAIKVSAEGRLVVGKINSSDTWQDDASHITSKDAVPTNEWFYLTVSFTVNHGSTAATRTATAKAYVNGVAIALPTTAFQCNYNASTAECAALKVGDNVECAGLRVDDAAVSDTAAMKAWAVNPKYVVSTRAEEIISAHWTGAAGDGDGMNPDNWACTNTAGQGVSGALPTNAEATVFLNAPLDRNLDWRGLGAFALAADSLVDLNGHEFAVGGFANRTDGVIITNANDGVTGDFVVDVAAGETVQNATVAILGNVRVVKNGAGDFVGAVTNQLYSGGTVVNAGTVRSVGYEKNLYYGDRDVAFVVNAGGALDINGQYDWCAHPIVLAGGTLRNGGAHQLQYTWNGLGDVTLTADSKMALKYHTLFKSDGAGLDLGGHALTVERTDTTAKILCSFSGTYTVMNGHLVSEKDIRLNLRQAGVILKDVNLTVNGSWIHNASTFSVVDLTENLTSGEGAGVVAVSGVFRTNGKFDNVRLVDGATLDLRDKTGPFSADSPLSGYSLTFGEGATVAVDLTGRTVAEGDKIIAWSAMPSATSRILGRGQSPSAPFYFVRRADGLYAARTPMIFVR